MNNTVLRAIFGTLYVVVLSAAIIYDKYSYLALMFSMMSLCIYEFQKMTKIKSIYTYKAGFSVYMAIASEIGGFLKEEQSEVLSKIAVVVFILTILIQFSKVLFNPPKDVISYLGKVFINYAYIIMPFAISLYIVFYNETKTYDFQIILGIFILIWVNDTFAYITGKTIGKHKLLERISPKKTIEGFVGGAVFTVASGYLLSLYFDNYNLRDWLIISVIVSFTGVVGDLIASMFR